MKPLVSVIIAVYNGEKYLGEAIESVLAQTYAPIELVILDDGSQDQTSQVAKRYGSKLRYFQQSNRGQPSAQNQAIRLTQGSYISFLDADDLYLPDKTALQMAFLEAHPQIDFVFGSVQQFFSPEAPLEFKQRWLCPPALTSGRLAAGGLFRKVCFEQVSFFNEEQRIGPFIEWYMRAMEKGLQEALIPNPVLQRRIHENNMGVHSQGSRLEYVRIVREALKRRLQIP